MVPNKGLNFHSLIDKEFELLMNPECHFVKPGLPQPVCD